jgi:hypothetical protein
LSEELRGAFHPVPPVRASVLSAEIFQTRLRGLVRPRATEAHLSYTTGTIRRKMVRRNDKSRRKRVKPVPPAGNASAK